MILLLLLLLLGRALKTMQTVCYSYRVATARILHDTTTTTATARQSSQELSRQCKQCVIAIE